MEKFLEDIITPMTTCLQLEMDPKVQTAACEAIHQIIKSYREDVLKNHQFDKIFGNIIQLIGS